MKPILFLGAACGRVIGRTVLRLEELVVSAIGGFAWLASLVFSLIYSPLRHRKDAYPSFG